MSTPTDRLALAAGIPFVVLAVAGLLGTTGVLRLAWWWPVLVLVVAGAAAVVVGTVRALLRPPEPQGSGITHEA